MSTEPLDYRTYSSILGQADALVRKTGKGLTRVDGLHALATTYPHDPRYAAAVRMSSRSSAPARAVVAKVVPLRTTAVEERGNGHPAAPVAKAMPAPTPPPSATETLMTQIAKRQKEQGLTFLQALDAVEKAAPELYAEYQRDARYPHLTGRPMPVAKEAAPSVEAIIKMACTQAQASGQTTKQALVGLAQADPQTYYAAYRQFIVSGAGLDEHLTRSIQGLGGKGS